jgi:hypothetical protein
MIGSVAFAPLLAFARFPLPRPRLTNLVTALAPEPPAIAGRPTPNLNCVSFAFRVLVERGGSSSSTLSCTSGSGSDGSSSSGSSSSSSWITTVAVDRVRALEPALLVARLSFRGEALRGGEAGGEGCELGGGLYCFSDW